MNYFKIHLLYFFRYVILNIGDGLMKIRCEMCGKKFDSDDARSRYDSEWGDSWARLWLLTNLILFLFIFRKKFKAYNEGIRGSKRMPTPEGLGL